jgi:NAD(P)-dependent dehydrogenase (short-subunit alcohol dehydrogenase family)
MPIVLMIGTPTAEVRALAKVLDAEWLEVPALEVADAAALEAFRHAQLAGASDQNRRRFAQLVVAVWRERAEPSPLVEIDQDEWEQRGEYPLLAWNVAMGVASQLVDDGGALVAVVEGPAPIDSPGWTPECAVAEAVIVLARSVAQSEGGRGVRANAVTTPLRLGGGVLAPAPALPDRFPGTLQGDVAATVRMLLSDDARAITASVSHADCGRTLR